MISYVYVRQVFKHGEIFSANLSVKTFAQHYTTLYAMLLSKPERVDHSSSSTDDRTAHKYMVIVFMEGSKAKLTIIKGVKYMLEIVHLP